MTFASRFSSRALIAACALSVLPLGGLAVHRADLAALGTNIVDGSYQRLYEGRFKAELTGQDALVAAWAALRLGLLAEVADGAVLGRDGWLFTAEEFTALADPLELSAALPRVQAALAPHGITLVPVIVPDKARIAADHLPRARSDRFAARYDRSLDALRATGLPALDLRPALAGGFLRTDTHWAPDGAARVAGQIADALAGAALDRPGFDSARTGTAPLDGDLRKFAAVGDWDVPNTPAPETIPTHVTTGGGLDLFGAAPVQVALVGTSFSARADLHFDGFLKSALGADVLNLALEGQGPLVPMDAFLADLNAGRMPDLRVVIWEIPERYLPLP